MRSLFLCLFSLLALSLQAQLFFSDTENNIGTYDINECNYELLGNRNIFDDIALSPDGRLFACNSSSEAIYIFEISSVDFRSLDTISIIEINYGGVTSLVCSPDNVLYFGHYGLFSYDLNTSNTVLHGTFPGAFQLVGDLLWHEGELYGSTVPISGIDVENPIANFIRIRFDENNIQLNDILVDDFPAFQGLSKVYDPLLSKTKLIGESPDLSPVSDTTRFYEISLQDTTVLELCSTVINPFIQTIAAQGIIGLTSTDEFRTNFNLRLDLDENDSSGRLIDHFLADSLCTWSFRLSDNDVSITAPAMGIDSMVLELSASDFDMEEVLLTCPAQTVFDITGLNSGRLVASPVDNATAEDYENLIRSIRFEIIAENLMSSESRVDFYLYSGSQTSDVSTAFIRTHPEVELYAGEGYDIDLCFSSSSDLLSLLGTDVYQEGRWEPALHNNGNRFNTYHDEPGVYLYIAQEGSCVADTAMVNVSIIPIPAINYNESVDDLQYVYLCPGDTAFWAIDTSIIESWEWDHGIIAPLAIITEPDIYGIWATDEYGCEYRARTKFVAAESYEPMTTQDTVYYCEGQVANFYGSTVENNQTICEEFLSTGDCDYTFCRTFVFGTLRDYFKYGSICEGEVYWQGETPLAEAGDYEFYIEDGECDTLLQLELTVHPTYERNLVVGLSPGGSYTVGDSVLTNAGLYDILLQSSQGCDSLIHIEIEIATATQRPDQPLGCQLPSMLKTGNQDLNFPSACDCALLTWTLYDVHGRRVASQKNGPMLLSTAEQNYLSSGLYVYEYRYRCEGKVYQDVGKMILVK